MGGEEKKDPDIRNGKRVSFPDFARKINKPFWPDVTNYVESFALPIFSCVTPGVIDLTKQLSVRISQNETRITRDCQKHVSNDAF